MEQLRGYAGVDQVRRRQQWEAAHANLGVKITFDQETRSWSATWSESRGDHELSGLLDQLTELFG